MTALRIRDETTLERGNSCLIEAHFDGLDL